MAFVRRCWYFADWSSALAAGKPLGLTIAGEPVVVFRTARGELVALNDRCPHRSAPLHRGEVRGESIECPYHGLQFGPSGACTLSPHGEGKVPAVRTPSYPVTEKFGGIWVWLDNASSPDADSIPAMGILDDIDRGAKVYFRMDVRANYQLIIDNLMDATHADFLHAGTLGSGDVVKHSPAVTSDGASILATWHVPRCVAVPTFVNVIPEGWGDVDTRVTSQWTPPNVVRVQVTVSPSSGETGGRPPLTTVAFHLLTPIDDHTTRYSYVSTWNFGGKTPEDLARKTERSRFTFAEQDIPIIEAQQQMMGEQSFWSLHSGLLPSDAAQLRVRRRLDEMIALEAN